MPKSYTEKLKDPRWQKRRLEILERDGFECRHCLDKTSELHVHHKYYTARKDPWDYSDDMLITLCHACHSRVGELSNRAAALICDVSATEAMDFFIRSMEESDAETRNHLFVLIRELWVNESNFIAPMANICRTILYWRRELRDSEQKLKLLSEQQTNHEPHNPNPDPAPAIH